MTDNGEQNGGNEVKVEKPILDDSIRLAMLRQLWGRLRVSAE